MLPVKRYRNNARDGRAMVSVSKLISKRLAKASQMRVLKFTNSVSSIKIRFDLWGFRRIFCSEVKD